MKIHILSYIRLVGILENIINMTKEFYDIYKSEYTAVLDNIKYDNINIAIGLIKNAKNIFIIGNGGSLNIASHFATDLRKTSKLYLSAISLDNISHITAIGNDLNFKDIFVEQLKGLAKDVDLLISFSTSGDSENILEAVHWAMHNGIITLSFTGLKGNLKTLSQYKVLIPSYNQLILESLFSYLTHYIIEVLLNEKSI